MHGADYLIVYTGISYITPTAEHHGQIHINKELFGVYLVDTSTMMYKKLNFSDTYFSAYCPIHCVTYKGEF